MNGQFRRTSSRESLPETVIIQGGSPAPCYRTGRRQVSVDKKIEEGGNKFSGGQVAGSTENYKLAWIEISGEQTAGGCLART
jgi:hypothetical protein